MKRNLLKILMVAAALVGIASCTKPASGGGDNPGYIDYAESEEVRLALDYAGHDFYTDGVGEVTLKSPIDGDTAHFYTVGSNTIVKSRFWGVDTPESTGRIEEYGAEASDFTKKKLQLASESGTIVVSTARSDYGEPSADSTGERYVSLIWVNFTTKHAPYKDLRLLNLMIVQEGLSYVKNVSDIPAYQTIFIAAEKQAKDLKFNLWSGEPAPGYNYGDYERCSLLDLKHNIEKTIEGIEMEEGESLAGAKVRINGTVAGFSDGTMYLQNFYTVEEGGNGTATNPYTGELGEYAGINIFCGMSAVPNKYRIPGTYIEICGNVVNSEIFGFQLTGAEGHFPSVESEAGPDDCHILLKAEDNNEEYQLYTFGYTIEEFDAIIANKDLQKKYESFYCSVKLEGAVECTKFYINSSKEITLTFGGHNFQAYLTTSYKGNPHNQRQVWQTEDKFVGKSFYISGVYAAYTGGSKPRFQFVFTKPMEQLLCTEYFNADGTVIPEAEA